MADGSVRTRAQSRAPKDWGRWRDYRAMVFESLTDDELCPCATCGRPTNKTTTKRCDGCWEVEHRLDSYIRDGGDRAIVLLLDALVRAGLKWFESPESLS